MNVNYLVWNYHTRVFCNGFFVSKYHHPALCNRPYRSYGRGPSANLVSGLTIANTAETNFLMCILKHRRLQDIQFLVTFPMTCHWDGCLTLVSTRRALATEPKSVKKWKYICPFNSQLISIIFYRTDILSFKYLR
jgi:hypothetical protein